MVRTQEEMAIKFTELKERSGLSWPEIAKAAGYAGQTSIQRFYTPGGSKKPYLPPNIIEALLKLMVGRGDPPIEDIEIMLLAPLLGFEKDQERQAATAQRQSGGFSNAPYTGTWTGNEKIPVIAYASASGERNAVNLEHDVPIRWIERPHWLVGVIKSAAVQIMGDSMYPRYMDGDLVFVNMSMPPVKGKDCIFNTKDGYTHIKQYIGQDKEYVRFHQWNPPKDISVHKRDIESMYAIVGRD